MCYNPQHIRNTTLHYSAYRDPLYFDVPCGKCEECKRARQSEWFVRCFYEWQYTKNHGGYAFFYTLTYNNDHLPKQFGIDCFSFSDIQLFCKRLKERLFRKYHANLKYIITTEYGSLTHRPHYHALFFISRFILPWSFYRQVEESWQKGFVYAGSDGGVVNSPNAILYVTKYITKDISFKDSFDALEAEFYKEYNRIYDNWLFFFDDISPDWHTLVEEHVKYSSSKSPHPAIQFYREYKKAVHDCTQFVAHSTKLGYCEKDNKFFGEFIEKINFKGNTILIPFGSEWRPIPLCRYFKRYFFYDRVPNETDGKRNKFILNKAGQQNFLDNLDGNITRLENQFKDFFAKTRLTDFQFLKYDKVGYFKFYSNSDMRLFLSNLDVDWHKMAIYCTCYRNRFYDKRWNLDPFVQYKEFIKEVFTLDIEKKYESLAIADKETLKFVHDNLFNFHPNFSLYEHIYILFRQMSHLIKSDMYLLKQFKEDVVKKSRQVINLQNPIAP